MATPGCTGIKPAPQRHVRRRSRIRRATLFAYPAPHHVRDRSSIRPRTSTCDGVRVFTTAANARATGRA
jgi:hypothetical protein